MRNSRRLACFVMTFLSVLLAMCTAETAEPARLTFSFWATGQEQEINQALAARFSELNPAIEVETMQMGGDYEGKIKVMTAAGNPPDILFMNPAAASSMYQQGALMNLRPYFDRDPRFADKSQYVLFSIPDMEHFSFMYEAENGMFMLPTRYNSFGTYYNIDYFQEAGLPLPGADFTWDKFLTAARKLVRVKDDSVERGGVTNLGTWQALIQAWVTGNDGRLVDKWDSPSRATLTEPHTVEALQFVQDLMAKERIMGGNLGAGTAAMHLSGFWSVETYRNRITSFRWGVAPWPYNRLRTTTILIAGYSVSSLTKHKDEAWQFVSWMLSPEAERLAYSQTAVWNPDLIEQGRPGSYYYQLPGLPEDYEFRVAAVNVRPAEWTGPKATDLGALWGDAFSDFAKGLRPAATIAADAEARINALLNEN